MINKNNIPKHWQIKKLGEVCTYSKGKKPLVLKETSTNDCSVPYINIKAFEKGIISEYTNGEKCNICNDDDLLMVWDGARCGLIGKAKKGAVGSTLMKILPKENIDKEYLYHFISSKYWTLNTKPKGVGIPHIEPTLLWNFELVVPPLPEQQAIVAKIEELFSELENGKQQLLTAQQQLKVYRQSLLKCAFEGKLTNKNVKEGELPKGWKIVELKDVAKLVSGFAFKSSDYISNGIPLVKISNIGYSQFVWKDQQFLAEQFYKTNSEYIIKSGDLLIALTRPITNNITKVCLYPTNTQDGLLNQRVACIKTLNVVKEYLFLFFQTNKFKQYIRSKFSETLQPNLSPKDLALTKIPLPSLEQQKFIVSELESKLTVCDKIQETISESLQQTETLKQSILKKAFEGKLI